MATHCLQWPPSSGKQLFTLLLRPTASSPLLVNLEANIVVRDAGFVTALAGELERDYAAAREITAPPPLAGWRRWLQRGFVAWAAGTYLRLAGNREPY